MHAGRNRGIERYEVILHLSLTVPVFSSFFTSAAPTENAVAGAGIDCHKEESLLACIKWPIAFATHQFSFFHIAGVKMKRDKAGATKSASLGSFLYLPVTQQFSCRARLRPLSTVVRLQPFPTCQSGELYPGGRDSTISSWGVALKPRIMVYRSRKSKRSNQHHHYLAVKLWPWLK